MTWATGNPDREAVDVWISRLTPAGGTTPPSPTVPPSPGPNPSPGLSVSPSPTPGSPAPSVGTPGGTSPPGLAVNPLCPGPASVLCLPQNLYPTSSTPGSPRQPCDPGSDSAWVNVLGTTFACIFSGDIWDDPVLLSAKQKCGFSLALDLLPFTKVLKFPKFAKLAGNLRSSMRQIAQRLRSASYPGKLTKDAGLVDDLRVGLDLITSPQQALLSAVSSRRVLDALILKLGRGGPETVRLAGDLAVVKAGFTTLIEAASGAQTVRECVVAFDGP